MGVVGVDQAVGIKSMNEKEFVLPYNSIFVLLFLFSVTIITSNKTVVSILQEPVILFCVRMGS